MRPKTLALHVSNTSGSGYLSMLKRLCGRWGIIWLVTKLVTASRLLSVCGAACREQPTLVLEVGSTWL